MKRFAMGCRIRELIIWSLLFAVTASCATSDEFPTSESPTSSDTCHGVAVAPTSSIEVLINANSPHTTFCFAAGTYALSDTISTGDRFPILDLRAGVVIDGQDGGFIGIDGEDPPPDQPGTIVLGGVFQHFGNAGSPEWVASIIVRRNSVVEGTEFRNNFNTGLAIQGDGARVSNVKTHHNGRYGMVVSGPCWGCPGPRNVVIEDTEIAFNNTRMLPTGDAAGGTKFTGGTDEMVVRGNTVHDNYGMGLWWDGYHTNAQIYDNMIYDNRSSGILWELSYGGTKIHDNTLTGNAEGGASWFNSQLLISSSDGSNGGIEIYSNTIDGSANPLALTNHNVHPTLTREVYVHDNTFILRSSASRVGAAGFDGLTEIFDASANNRFDRNAYRVPSIDAAYWGWNGQSLTWTQWQGLGHDRNGAISLTP